MQPVFEILVRLASYFQSRDCQYTTLAELRWMGIIKVIIGFFCDLPHFPPSQLENWGRSKLGFGDKLRWFSENTRNTKYQNPKRTQRAESTAPCGHFGTYPNTKLPIGSENGPSKVESLNILSFKERRNRHNNSHVTFLHISLAFTLM